MFLPVVLGLTYANFSENVAKNDMLPLSAAAYSQNPQACLTNIFKDGNLKRQVNVKCGLDIDDICSGFTAVIPSRKAIVVSFRGTNTFLQLVSEGTTTIFNTKIDWIAGGKVARYFGDGFLRLWNQGMKDDFVTLLNKNPSYEVWVTGHSLGGALASLAASYIVSTKLVTQDKIKLVTFGEPRVGNSDYATAHDSQLGYAFRIVHWEDLVPHVPPKELFYAHSRQEIFYNEKMNKYTICQEDEDKKCSDGLLLPVSILDHLSYFGKVINIYGSQGCR